MAEQPGLAPEVEQELGIRFSYHPPKSGQPDIYQAVRNYARNFAAFLASVAPESDELTESIKKLEEAVMWANASIARRS